MSIFTNQSLDQISPSSGYNYTGSGSPTTTMLATSGGTFHLYVQSSNNASVLMGFNATPAISTTAPTGRIVLPDASAWYVTGQLICSRGDYSNGSATATNPVAFDIAFSAGRGGNAASTVLIDTPTKTKVFGANNINMTTGAITIAANTTAGSIDITVTGEASVNYNWSGFFTFVRTGA